MKRDLLTDDRLFFLFNFFFFTFVFLSHVHYCFIKVDFYSLLHYENMPIIKVGFKGVKII